MAAVAAPAILRFGAGTAQATTTLKISHQFPAAPSTRAVRTGLPMFAAGQRQRRRDIRGPSNLADEDQRAFSAMRKGALDIGLYPSLCRRRRNHRPDAGAGLDRSGPALKGQPVGKALTDFLADKASSS
jgi:hypothetical protein